MFEILQLAEMAVGTIVLAFIALVAICLVLKVNPFACAGDYIPAKLVDLDVWATTFDSVITATPTDYGLDAGQATAFHTLRSAFSTALALSTDPSTRTPVTVANTVTARNSMVANARQLGQIAQRFPGITPTLLAAAGLTVPAPVPTPIPAPTSNPILSPMGSASLQLTVRAKDSVLTNPRAKPFGATSMQLYVKIDGEAPTDVSTCVFLGNFSRVPAVIDFVGGTGGKMAWLIGRWVTAKGLVGPSSPVSGQTIPA